MDSIFFAYLTVVTLPSYLGFLFLINYCVVCLRINRKPGLLHENCHIFLKQSNILSKFWILLESHCFTLPLTFWNSLWDFVDCSYIYMYMYTHSIAVSWQISFPLSYCCFLADSFFLSFYVFIAISWRTSFYLSLMFLLLFNGRLLFFSLMFLLRFHGRLLLLLFSLMIFWLTSSFVLQRAPTTSPAFGDLSKELHSA